MEKFDQQQEVAKAKRYLSQLEERRFLLENLIKTEKPSSLVIQAAMAELHGVNVAIVWLLDKTSFWSNQG